MRRATKFRLEMTFYIAFLLFSIAMYVYALWRSGITW